MGFGCSKTVNGEMTLAVKTQMPHVTEAALTGRVKYINSQNSSNSQ